MSHLRFSPESKIEAPFRVEDSQAGYVACHNEGYVQKNKFDVVKFLKRRGTFFLNTTVASIADADERVKALEALMDQKLLRQLALKNAQFYIMDAASLATDYGLAGRINMICMCAFFRLSGVLPLDDAVALLKAAIKKNYSYKGDAVVQNNIDLLDAVVNDPKYMLQVEIPSSWRGIHVHNKPAYQDRHIELMEDEKTRKFLDDIAIPIARLEYV